MEKGTSKKINNIKKYKRMSIGVSLVRRSVLKIEQ